MPQPRLREPSAARPHVTQGLLRPWPHALRLGVLERRGLRQHGHGIDGAPAAAYFYSPDRRGEHPESFLGGFGGILQADAYSGFGRLYEYGRQPGPIREAACWAHGRRNFFKLAVEEAPLAIEAVKRVDAILAIEREINGLTAGTRLAARAERSRPLVDDLESGLAITAAESDSGVA